MPRTRNPKEKFRLEDHLLLARFIGSKIGVKEVKDIQNFSDVPEGTDTNGHSYMYSRIISRGGRLIEGEKLQQYDQNIRHYTEKISKNMPKPINFKYYQYLALLYNEIYLDRLFHHFNRPIFLNDINEWAVENNVKTFSRKDLRKIAYWMATGSGKTFIMHANYWQFLNYNKGPNRIDYNNIILVTANDGMSKQHLCDLEKSGIPAGLYDGAGYFEESRDKIKVISIHKLKLPEDKRGKGVTVDVTRLGTRNLVFVDEGHKGQKSEDRVWKRVRELLAKDGFTFEYSATFGQVITSDKSDYYNEYTRSIIFDYSYKYFNIDGYGKDFRVLNLEPKQFAEAQTRTLLLANALAFYEQLVLYSQLGSNIQEYNIEKPLWIFVGSKVRGENSDIVEVVKFLHWFLSEEAEVKRIIGDILAGESGIIADGQDAFTPTYPDRNFSYLRETRITPDQAYEGILNEVFNLQSGQGRTLQIINLKNAEGEIALKVGIAPKFFAVINIGDKPRLLKLIGERLPNLPHLNAELSPSQFEKINQPESNINILIGAKKFIEGWNSWRVSNMCLLNVGKSEGPQIIQLFGRGVRLKGRGLSLKRSRFLEPPNPPLIEILETLQIYGVRAKYMETFKRTLDIEDALSYELTLPTEIIDPFPNDLQTLVVDENWSFENTLLRLTVEDYVRVKLNLLPRVEIIDSRGEALTAEVQTPHRVISMEILDLLDWDKIHHALLEYKTQKNLYNIVINKEVLKNIMYESRYTLTCTEDLIAPLDFKSLQTVVEKITIQILELYLNRYYSARKVAEEKHHYHLKPLHVGNDNILKSYKVKVTEENKQLAEYLQKIIDEKTIYDSGESRPSPDMRFISAPFTFRNALFKGHLYQPLLIRQANKSIVTIPTGLNKGEKKFVEELNTYVTSKKPSENIYLLRNRTRGKGIGFYDHHSFYPDFILWMKKDEKQVIVFIDPKGIARLDIDEDEKLNLHNYLKDEVQSCLNNPNVELDAFIVSVTSHEKAQYYLKRRINIKEYEKKHLLFQEIKEGVTNPTYMETLFKMALTHD